MPLVRAYAFCRRSPRTLRHPQALQPGAPCPLRQRCRGGQDRADSAEGLGVGALELRTPARGCAGDRGGASGGGAGTGGSASTVSSKTGAEGTGAGGDGGGAGGGSSMAMPSMGISTSPVVGWLPRSSSITDTSPVPALPAACSGAPTRPIAKNPRKRAATAIAIAAQFKNERSSEVIVAQSYFTGALDPRDLRRAA